MKELTYFLNIVHQLLPYVAKKIDGALIIRSRSGIFVGWKRAIVGTTLSWRSFPTDEEGHVGAVAKTIASSKWPSSMHRRTLSSSQIPSFKPPRVSVVRNNFSPLCRFAPSWLLPVAVDAISHQKQLQAKVRAVKSTIKIQSSTRLKASFAQV